MNPVLQGLLEELECPVCREYVVAPIAMCVSGHSVCTTCRYKMYRCPVCTKPFSISRNYALENIAGKMMYPCKYQEEGCNESLTLQQRAAHHAECSHQTHKCPFSLLDKEPCRWEGSPATIVNHIKNNHSDLCSSLQVGRFKRRLWDIDTGPFWCRAMFAMDEVFFWYTALKDSHVYSSVFYVGPAVNASSYKYRITVSKDDKFGTAVACHVTSSYHKSINEVFQNCECVVFHREFVKKCMDIKKRMLVEVEIFRSMS